MSSVLFKTIREVNLKLSEVMTIDLLIFKTLIQAQYSIDERECNTCNGKGVRFRFWTLLHRYNGNLM